MARLKSDIDPKLISKFDRTIQRTYTPTRIQKSLKWARLFGGAGALMVIDGHEEILDEPLDLDTIAPGSYKGLIVFDRWSGIYPDGSIATNINSPVDFGQPEYYVVNGPEQSDSFRIHHSRILKFCGPDVPYPEYTANQYWGISELEICYEEIRKRDNMSWSILQLLFRAQILTQKNPQLAQLLSGANASANRMTRDIRIYEQDVAQKQTDELEPNLHKLYPVVCMSEFGEVPDDLDIEFPSVRVLTEEEKSTLAKDSGTLIIDMFNAGLISQKTHCRSFSNWPIRLR
ncbi:unnamed protein product [Sphagnum jensenii]|uniref:Anti-CBASS protein Acb1-like N-terminal domain-containing protein n=1 Tax=Sphagnum jensenii TaxID=128206 RepID=A0ABP0V6F3_9BRYO